MPVAGKQMATGLLTLEARVLAPALATATQAGEVKRP